MRLSARKTKDSISLNEPLPCCGGTEVSKYDPELRMGFNERHPVPSQDVYQEDQMDEKHVAPVVVCFPG